MRIEFGQSGLQREYVAELYTTEVNGERIHAITVGALGTEQRYAGRNQEFIDSYGFHPREKVALWVLEQLRRLTSNGQDVGLHVANLDTMLGLAFDDLASDDLASESSNGRIKELPE